MKVCEKCGKQFYTNENYNYIHSNTCYGCRKLKTGNRKYAYSKLQIRFVENIAVGFTCRKCENKFSSCYWEVLGYQARLGKYFCVRCGENLSKFHFIEVVRPFLGSNAISGSPVRLGSDWIRG